MCDLEVDDWGYVSVYTDGACFDNGRSNLRAGMNESNLFYCAFSIAQEGACGDEYSDDDSYYWDSDSDY